MKRIETQVDLPATPSVVWQQLVDTATMGSWNPWLFDGRHSFTLTPLGEKCTRLVQAEDFSGALIPFAGKLLSKTEAGFEAMNAALLTRLENDQPESTTAAADVLGLPSGGRY
jgi:hypothetical protein